MTTQLPRDPTTDPDGWARDLTAQFQAEMLSKRTENLRLDDPPSRTPPPPPVPAKISQDRPAAHHRPSDHRPSAHRSSGSDRKDKERHHESSLRKSKSKAALSGSSKHQEVGPDGLPAYSKNAPRIPVPPQPEHKKFRTLMHTWSLVPVDYENNKMLDEALKLVPLDRIYTEAQGEWDLLRASAESLKKDKTKWGYQDCVIMALKKWFKNDFFSWVDNPICTQCYNITHSVGESPATDEEKARGASRVELHKCQNCGNHERFARYNDVWTLMMERRGRCGEWANCFTMFCRAMGLKARIVWCSEDRVWTEVFSEHAEKWIHVDACENLWNQPRVYAESWGAKMGYCIAFSPEGAVDVTRRYVRNHPKHGRERTKCPEEVLLYILNEITQKRRNNLVSKGTCTKEDLDRMEKRDEKERKELKYYVYYALVEEGLIDPKTGKRTARAESSSGDSEKRRHRERAEVRPAAQQQDSH